MDWAPPGRLAGNPGGGLWVAASERSGDGIDTVLMTAGFATVREIPWIQAIMKGVIPAAIGLSFAMGVQMAQPIFASARKDYLFY